MDPEGQTALVEPGVLTDEISAAALAHGLRYLPDPASAAACTIGGNVATNSGGPHCLKHGVTTDHVAALEVILPDGTPLVVRRGEEGGLDLAGIFIGSEGTLGVISRIRVNLAPLANNVRTFLALFDSVADAGRAVGQIFEAGVVPVALELVDRETIAVVEASVFAAGLPLDTEAALVVECEGDPEETAEDLAAAESAVLACGAREVRHAHDEAERLAIWQARKKAYGALGRLAPDVFVQDAAVPRSSLPIFCPDSRRSHGGTISGSRTSSTPETATFTPISCSIGAMPTRSPGSRRRGRKSWPSAWRRGARLPASTASAPTRCNIWSSCSASRSWIQCGP